MKRLTFSLALLAPLFAVQKAEAYRDEVRLEKARVAEIQATLFGQPTKPGLIPAGRPFKARFRDVVMTRPEAWQLVGSLLDAANLPPDSVLEIRGHMDGENFQVQVESNKEGRKVAKLEGLPFPDRGDVTRFLDELRGRGMREVKLEAVVGSQRVAGRIENGQTRIEG